jgi:hypothetical protein
VKSLRLRQSRVDLLFLSLMILAVWLPRGLALDRFVTVDEPKWLARSGNFFSALVKGDFAGTFTREHPGVTVTIAGTAALLWQDPTYPQEVTKRLTNSSEIKPILRGQGIQPMAVLEAGRILMVLAITATLAVTFWQAARLSGWWMASAGFLLIAFDPFHIGLSRLLHLDGLMSSLMLLSILAYLSYLFHPNESSNRKTVSVVLSGMAAGLSWLTKSPAFFLAPFLGLITLIMVAYGWVGRRRIVLRDLWKAGGVLVLWAIVGWLVFFILWPAMWVNPLGSLERVFAEATTYASEGHTTDIFFNGAVISGDPGLRFYPLVYLWRTTPVVLVGLGFTGLSFILRPESEAERKSRWVAAALLFFAATFSVFMTLGSKKFDRYLLPIFPALDLVAGIGWVIAARWFMKSWRGASSRVVVFLILGLAFVFQGYSALMTYPYYLSYYNPIMGGSAKAPQVMMIGWGEGLDQAARYLNTKPNAKSMRVMSWYPDGPFSYIFNGETIGLAPEWDQNKTRIENSNYVVLYIHEWQREIPFPEMLDYFSKLQPEKVITINGLNYAQIYNMKGAIPP